MEFLKGNAVVGQSGGPTAAINATLAGVLEGFRDAAGGADKFSVFGMRNGIEGFMRDELIDLTPLAREDGRLRDLAATPAAALGSCRKKLPEPELDRLAAGRYRARRPRPYRGPESPRFCRKICKITRKYYAG